MNSLIFQLVKNSPEKKKKRICLQCGRPGLGRFLGEGEGYPLQYAGLENSVDCIVSGVTKSQTGLSHFHFHNEFQEFWVRNKLGMK